MNLESLKELSRKELQALAKDNGVKANLSTASLIEELSHILCKTEELVTEVPQVVIEPIVVEISVQPVVIDDSKKIDAQNSQVEVGDEVEAFIADTWSSVTVKRVNKASYRVVSADGSEVTVKTDLVRKLSPAVEVSSTSEVETVIAPAEESVVVEIENDDANDDSDEERSMLSCIEDSLQEYSMHMQEESDAEEGEDEAEYGDVIIGNMEEEEPMESENIETNAEMEITVEQEEEPVVIAEEVVESSVPHVAFDAAIIPLKKTSFVTADSAVAVNPFSKLTAKTPVKGSRPEKVTWNSGHKLVHVATSSRASIAVTSSSVTHNANQTPKNIRKTMYGKAINSSAVVPTAKTPTTLKNVSSSSASTASVVQPKMTKAQQMRNEAVANKFTNQADESSQGSFQFKTAGSTNGLAATNAIKPSIGAATPRAKTPGSTTAALATQKVKTGGSVVAGSVKRKLTTAFGVTASSSNGQNISSHLDAIPTVSATPAPVAPTTAKKSTIGPDFSKMHSAQFSNSKPISSMVHRNKSIAVKMTTAFDNEMSGAGPSFAMGSAPTPFQANATKKAINVKQPFSRSASTARARPTPTTTNTSSTTPAVSVPRRSSSVTVPSSRIALAVTPAVAFSKTPVKSAPNTALAITDKENIVGSANKFVNTSRRASHFSGKARGTDIQRDIRRNSFMDEVNAKRQMSATKARNMNNVTKMETLDESAEIVEHSFVLESPGPFTARLSPQEF